MRVKQGKEGFCSDLDYGTRNERFLYGQKMEARRIYGWIYDPKDIMNMGNGELDTEQKNMKRKYYYCLTDIQGWHDIQRKHDCHTPKLA